MVRIERLHLCLCHFWILIFVKMFSGYSANPVVTTLCVRHADVVKATGWGSKWASERGRMATEAAAFNYHGTLASCGLWGGSAAGHCIRRGLIKGDVPSARTVKTHFPLPGESLHWSWSCGGTFVKVAPSSTAQSWCVPTEHCTRNDAIKVIHFIRQRFLCCGGRVSFSYTRSRARGYMGLPIKGRRETGDALQKQEEAFTPYLPAALHMETNLLLLSLSLPVPTTCTASKPEQIQGPPCVCVCVRHFKLFLDLSLILDLLVYIYPQLRTKIHIVKCNRTKWKMLNSIRSSKKTQQRWRLKTTCDTNCWLAQVGSILYFLPSKFLLSNTCP